MPSGYPRKNCKVCLRDVDECGALSKRGKCQDCARFLQAESIANLRNHDGPFFHKWRVNHAASVGGVLLDELIPKG